LILKKLSQMALHRKAAPFFCFWQPENTLTAGALHGILLYV
jgi:hypothetical protein